MDFFNHVKDTIEGAGFTWAGIAFAICILAGIIIGFIRGLVKELVSLVIVFATIAMVWFLNPYVNQFLKERTPIEEKIAEQTSRLIGDNIPSGRAVQADEQGDFISNLGLPDFLRDALLQHNNAEGYKALKVSSFGDYISAFLSDLIVNGISFLITYFTVTILIQVLVFVLDIFTRLPVIHGLNKLGGALLGGAKYVVFIWIFMLIATVLMYTGIGRDVLHLIEQDQFLKKLYDWNPFIRFFMNMPA